MAEENLSLKDSWSSREPPYQTASADPFTRERVKHLFHRLSCSKDELLDLKETEQNGHWYVYHAALETCLTWNKTFSCPPLEKILHSDKDSTAKEKHQKILVLHLSTRTEAWDPLCLWIYSLSPAPQDSGFDLDTPGVSPKEHKVYEADHSGSQAGPTLPTCHLCLK